MPRTTSVHVDQALSNLSIAYKPAGFIAEEVFPVVPVMKKSDEYFEYALRNHFQDVEGITEPGEEAPWVDWDVSAATYNAKTYKWKDKVADEERDNADPALDLERDTTEFLTDIMLIQQDKRILASLTSTAVLTQNTTLTGTNRWSDYANSNPFGDIQTGRSAIHQATGKNPNVMLVGRQVHDKLIHHPDILERIKYVQRGIVTADLLAAVFEVERYVVSEAQADSANKGQTASLSYLMGKDVVLAVKPPRPSLKMIALGAIFRFRQQLIKRYREEKIESDVFEISHSQDEKLIAAACGYLIKTAVA